MWLIALYHNQGGPLVPDQLPEGDRMKWQPLARADAPLDAHHRQLRRLMPYQNLFYLRWLLTQVQDKAADELDLPGK